MKQFWLLVGGLVGLAVLCGAARQLDGLRVDNGGSTNTASWSFSLKSDGSGWVYGDPADHPFNIGPALARRTFVHVAAARRAAASGAPCMKSASFGTRTTVSWHGWRSSDLSCPQNDPALAALAADIAQIQTLAQIRNAPRRPLMPEPRRVPNEGLPGSPPPTASPAEDRSRSN